MGKSGGRKKKQAGSGVENGRHSANGGVDVDSSVFLKRAQELKEEGNKRFQDKDYGGALDHYDKALKLTPQSHPDRAVFHSNKAACLMQMKPIDYETVIAECTLSLQVQPRFFRALLRRARAFEALGKTDLALQDVHLLLSSDPNHRDALEISRRLGPRHESPELHSRPSPAALGASAVRGAPIAGLGPCLPARPVPKKPTSAFKGDKPPVSVPPENPLPKPIVPELKSSQNSTVVEEHKDLTIDKPHRPLKLVYDHDIRLAQMPIKCGLKELRDIVRNKFPSSKSVLIKYKDGDGDLVTITSTSDLRLAETTLTSAEVLRLHIVEVVAEQEPAIIEDEEEEVEKETEKQTATVSRDDDDDKTKKPLSKETESKEAEMDDWLFDFAQLFRSHVGIDPDAHIDLHEVGMELCSEALEETVTSEEAQSLFDKAAMKFQEVAALAFFNWGNVYMCAARKRIPLDDSLGNDVVSSQLQVAYDWVKEKYTMAREKYEEALSVKPDFYEGLLALGQQQFEMAKLHWSYALARKVDLSTWEAKETLDLFESAEEKMTSATAMWEKLEEEREREKREEEVGKRKKKQDAEERAREVELTAEEATVMRSQIHLFWGNMLFERSQVECKLGMGGWEKHLETAVERFKLAGASEADISTVMKNHFSNDLNLVATDLSA